MTVLLDGYIFPVAFHGTPLLPPYTRPIVEQSFWGISGVQVLVGQTQSRSLTLNATLSRYSSVLDLMHRVSDMDNQLRDGLSGTLVVDNVYYPDCLFSGWRPSAPPFLDGSGVNGWVQSGELAWLQVHATTGSVQ